MYRLTRITTEPASVLQILIDQGDPQSPDTGMTVGGSLRFEPGEALAVSPVAAGVIMGDPDLARHFECEPPWTDPNVPPVPEPAPEAVEGPKRQRRGKAQPDA